MRTLAGVEVVGEVGTGAAAVRETALTRPDVVILDLRMPELDGVEAARRITAGFPDTGILVLTMFDEDELVSQALAAGARGYLLKGAEPDEIERAVWAVASGSAILSPQVAGRLRGPRAEPAPFPGLTPREREVLVLLARGLSNTAIAAHLGIAPKTLGNHISAVFRGLGVSTRAEAIVRARDGGLGA
ncbi:response regulator transcription factor [Pseudonocardia sp. WMMC193]|uniref:response regulator n=1 Tax=Pseudonocardia sp. WMMC193 TaxID=2911965 RepID=UPI001F22DDE2|nr:response regulator transcription factor [Pseudonocardia sp. WMMC193]MCF7550098.1 response regulator transcription factor [Pseudonocardia sp. WMMC193]